MSVSQKLTAGLCCRSTGLKVQPLLLSYVVCIAGHALFFGQCWSMGSGSFCPQFQLPKGIMACSCNTPLVKGYPHIENATYACQHLCQHQPRHEVLCTASGLPPARLCSNLHCVKMYGFDSMHTALAPFNLSHSCRNPAALMLTIYRGFPDDLAEAQAASCFTTACLLTLIGRALHF